MGKKERKTKSKERKPTKRGNALGWLIVVGVGASLVMAFVFFAPRSEPWGLPAIPRNPTPATLPPELFTGQVAKVYRIAQEVPELLERIPCYCGCYVSDRHQNNLDCYTDRHSVG
jgi:hypothetical protein